MMNSDLDEYVKVGKATFAKATCAGPASTAQGRTAAVRTGPRVGRNDPCPCGSGKKYKKCHLISADAASETCGGRVSLGGMIQECPRCGSQDTDSSPPEFPEREWKRATKGLRWPRSTAKKYSPHGSIAERRWRQFCPHCGAVGLTVTMVGQCERCERSSIGIVLYDDPKKREGFDPGKQDAEGFLPLPTAPSEWPPVAWGAEPLESEPWHMLSGAALEAVIRLKAQEARMRRAG